jgi:hypothetical protein
MMSFQGAAYMSARDVVEMMAIAQKGLIASDKEMDEKLRRQSVRLLEKAARHVDATALFAVMLAAVDESIFGNDPTIEENEDGVTDPETPDSEDIDEDSPAAGPADEGVTDDEGDEATDMNGNSKEKAAVGGIVKEMRPLNVVAAFAANLERLRG